MEVQSVARAFSIIEYICETGSGGVSEVARELKLNKSTAFGLIRSLVSIGYLQQIPGSTDYELSLKVCSISAKVLKRIHVREYARPYLEKLSEKYGESVHLVVSSSRESIYIDKIESTKSIRIFTSIGDRLPLHATGVGKSILAFRSHKEQVDYMDGGELQRFTDLTITAPQVLMDELDGIRKRGYSIDRGERFEDVFCIAVPLFNSQMEPVYAVSISMPVFRSKQKHTEQIVRDLIDVKHNIERILR